MRGSRKNFQRGPKFDNFCFCFLVDKGIEEPFPAINGPPSARQRNAIKLAFRLRTADDPALNADLIALSFFRGSGPRIAKKPYIFVIFQGESGPLSPSGSAHVYMSDETSLSVPETLHTLHFQLSILCFQKITYLRIYLTSLPLLWGAVW